jgi:YVTN family beta-propeller protein
VLLSQDGSTAYVTSEVSNAVHVIDVTSRKQVSYIPVGKRPRRGVLTPDGKSLWVTNELGASISVIHLATAQVSHTIGLRVQGLRATDITPVGVVMNSAGTVAWVALGRANRIARIDVASKTITDLILAGQRSWGLTLSPDEKRLYVTNGLSDDMTIIDAVTSKAIRTVPAGRVPHTVVLSP